MNNSASDTETLKNTTRLYDAITLALEPLTQFLLMAGASGDSDSYRFAGVAGTLLESAEAKLELLCKVLEKHSGGRIQLEVEAYDDRTWHAPEAIGVIIEEASREEGSA